MGYLADELELDQETAGEALARQLAESDFDLIAALRRVREAKHLSQAQLGLLMGLTQATVSAFESGDTEARLSTIRRYAHALNARVEHRVTCNGAQFTRCGYIATWSGRATHGEAAVGVLPFESGTILAASKSQSAFALSA